VKNRTGLIIAGVSVAVIGLMVYSSMDLVGFRVEVCKEFRGRSACRTASGSNREAAQRTASDNACALISSGMTDSIACQGSNPVSVKWLKGT
jgi:hypothetical protein